MSSPDSIQIWFRAIRGLVHSTVHNTHAASGISRAFQHVNPRIAATVHSQIRDWKTSHIHKPKTSNQDIDSSAVEIRVLVRNILSAIPDLANILKPLAHECAKSIVASISNNADKDTQQNYERKCAAAQASLLDSWLTRLVGVLVTIYAGCRADGSRVLAMNPGRCQIGSGLMSASPDVVAQNTIRFLLPTLDRFSHTQPTIQKLALVYLTGIALTDQVSLGEIHNLVGNLNEHFNTGTLRDTRNDENDVDDLTHLLQLVVARAARDCSNCASCCWAAAALIHSGANINAVDDYGRSAANTALNNPCTHMFALLQGLHTYAVAKHVVVGVPHAETRKRRGKNRVGTSTLADMHEETNTLKEKVDVLEERLSRAFSAIAQCLR